MRKYVKASSDSRKIPYDLVSALVILRDYADVSRSYLTDEHEKLVDISDTLYNVGWFDELVSRIKSNYPDIFKKYGEDFFKKVLDDASAIDSQIRPNNVQDLIDEYVLKATEFENGSSVESTTKINCVGHNDPGQYYDLIDYFDVWGNEEDGWEVNNLGPIEKKIWLSDDITEEELFNYLKDTIGYFNKNTKFSDVIIEWNDPYFIEFFQADNYYPLGRLEKSYEQVNAATNPLNSYEKKQCIDQIAYDYGVSKKKATDIYRNWDDAARRAILDGAKANAKKSFYED